MKKIIVLLLVISLFGCSKSIDIRLEPEVQMVFSKDNPRQIHITKKDDIYVLLDTWLLENKTGWYATSGRYPGGVYIKSGDNGIQITESQVVIYSTKQNGPIALYIQDIEKGQLNEIINFAK